MSEPTSAMSGTGPGGPPESPVGDPPGSAAGPAPDLSPDPAPDLSPEAGWQRLVVPVLALVAALAALVAFGVLSLLPSVTQPYAGQPLELLPPQGESPFKGFAVQPERPAPDLTLTDQSGQPWSLADQRGKAVALFFGYTHCPDICPQTMLTLAQTMTDLGPAAADLTVALVTVDPERDSPAAMAEYVSSFDPRFVGLSGTPAEIQAVARDYGIQYMKELPPAQATQAALLAGQEAPEGGTASPEGHGAASVVTPGSEAYTVAHSGVVLLIDPQGQLRASYLGPFDPADVAHDVRLLLAER